MRMPVVDRVRDLMGVDGLDAVVATSPENIAWLAGFVVPSQPLMRWRHAAVVVTADALGFLAVDMEETTVRERVDTAAVAVRVWGEFSGDPMTTLAALLADLGAPRGRIGLELDHLPAGDHARLADAVPGATLVGVERELARLRARKTDDELDLLGRLSRISDRAIGDAFRAVRAGDTELDLAAALTASVYAQGAESFKLMIVATGERSQLPNVGPTDRRLVPGDVCRVEIFSVLDGYQAGVCRTAVVGSAPPEAERIWANLVTCKHLLMDAIRPGVSSQKVWRVFREKFDELGLPPIAFVGHGIGVHLHEHPYLGPHTDEPLEPGVVLGVEPLVYRTGRGFGMQLKDMMAVTAEGCRLLSDVTDTERLSVIDA
jgi:Xaa-Pro dipeptidase